MKTNRGKWKKRIQILKFLFRKIRSVSNLDIEVISSKAKSVLNMVTLVELWRQNRKLNFFVISKCLLSIKFSGIFSRKFFTRLGLRLAKNFQDSPGYWNVLNFIRPFHVINAVNHFNFTKFKEENFSSLLVKLLFCCCDEGLTESLQVRSDLLDSNWELLEPKRRGFYYSMKTWQNALALLTVLLWGNIITTATVDHWRR